MRLSLALRETMRVQGGVVPLLDRHLARLGAGGCTPAVVQAAADAAMSAAAGWEPPYGRMTLVVSTDGSIEVVVTGQPSTIEVEGGPRIALVESTEPPLPPGAAKPADRSFWDRTLVVAREQGADVAVLVAPDGHLIDTSQATLWIARGDTLLTPPSPPALAGVSRGFVFDVAPELGSTAEESLLLAADLESADEVILTTAVAGARAVRGRGGPTARALQAAFVRAFGG